MLAILAHRDYARLFAAQVVALLGTGLLTVALGLLAYDLAGDRAGAVLGAAFTIKMVAYVGLSPVANALAARLPRKAVLVGADLIRLAVALCLPFIDAVWQIYVLIFVLQTASAAFTPAFQATIPDLLTKEADYTKALSLSRLAYELENLLSPALAGLLLTFMSFHWLFGGTALGFAASAALVLAAAIPARAEDARARPFAERLTRGARIYLATPRLRGLLALNLAAAAGGAFVLVNTVVMVRVVYAGSETDLALALAAFGAGAMAAALALPRLLETTPDRAVMLAGAAALTLLTLGHGALLTMSEPLPWAGFLALWAVSGLAWSATLTPGGRLLRRSARKEDRPDVFTAQFALSHLCWLVAYPVAGWLGAAAGMGAALIALGLLGLAGLAAAVALWPESGRRVLEHDHPDLPPDHPHLKAHDGRRRHAHVFVIDDEHRVWPSHG